MTRNGCANLRQLTRSDDVAKDANNEPKFALRSYPMLERLLAHRRELDLKVEIMCSDEQVFLEGGEFFSGREFNQNGQRQSFVHNRLPDIEHADLVGGQGLGQRTCQSGPITSRNVNQNDLVHWKGASQYRLTGRNGWQ